MRRKPVCLQRLHRANSNLRCRLWPSRSLAIAGSVWTRRVRAIVVNPKVVNPAKRADPCAAGFTRIWKGKLCLRNRKKMSTTSPWWLISSHRVGEASTKAWLKGVTADVSQPYFTGDIGLDSGGCPQAVWRALSITITWPACCRARNGRKDQQLARKVSIVMPKPAHVNISAAAVSRYAINKPEAIQLIEFLASPNRQRRSCWTDI